MNKTRCTISHLTHPSSLISSPLTSSLSLSHQHRARRCVMVRRGSKLCVYVYERERERNRTWELRRRSLVTDTCEFYDVDFMLTCTLLSCSVCAGVCLRYVIAVVLQLLQDARREGGHRGAEERSRDTRHAAGGGPIPQYQAAKHECC